MAEPASPDKIPVDSSQPTTPERESDPILRESQAGKLNQSGSNSHDAKNSTNGRVEDGELDGHSSDTAQSDSSKPRGINGFGHEPGLENDHDEQSERPSKRQRRDVTPPPISRKPKPISPPWKKFAADGPTSFSENGRRRSGRVNLTTVEPEPPRSKRLTRTAGGTQSSPPSKGHQTPTNKQSKPANGSHKRTPSTTKSTSNHYKPAPISTPIPSKRPVSQPKSSTRSSRRRSPSPPTQPTRSSTRSRRSARFDDHKVSQPRSPDRSRHDAVGKSPRIKLRVTRSGVIPLVHPGQVPKRTKLGSSFEDFWTRAGDIPVEDGGLLASEDGPSYTNELALKDAQIIIRVEKESEAGGLLSLERCSIYVPEGVDEPARQFARQDHMLKAMTNFRKLMVMEQQRHRVAAKKVAEACREVWLRRQPKSDEQVEAEARDFWVSRYRFVTRTMFGMWEGVRVEVNRQRLEAWEAEEQRRVKAALNEAVMKSEAQLQARKELESEVQSDDEDGFSELSDDLSADGEVGDESDLASDDGNEDLKSDVMSSSDDDDGDAVEDGGDAGLTQEQLREKYANIPALQKALPKRAKPDSIPEDPATEVDSKQEGETSDESVDMDDDMGSSDEDDEESDEEDDEEDSEEEAPGLLGLLFGKSELKTMEGNQKEDDPDEAASDQNVDIDMADATTHEAPLTNGHHDLPDDSDRDDISLVRYADSETNSGGRSRDASLGPTSPAGTMEKDGVVVDGPTPIAKVNDATSIDVVANVNSTTDVTDSTHPAQAGELQAFSAITVKVSVMESEATNGGSPTTASTPKALETIHEPEDSKTAVQTSDVSVSPQPSSTHKTEVPFLLRGTLREYQHDGLDWLAGLYANNTNGILADEMGLGKTIQTIALLAHLASYHEVWGPHLVVVPTSVMLNWEMEFKKWCPGFKILAYYGSQDERKRKRQGWNNDDVWNVCITSYQLVLQDQQVFKRRRWHYMILDEAHNIKNFKSQRWQTLLGFNTQARLLLTGTPLQNNLTELWSLLFFLMPAANGVGGFADLQEFHDWFHKPETQILESGREQMDDEARAIISKLHKVLRPYLLRRLKADVEKQMPAKYEHVEFCRLSKRQRELYDGFLARADTKHTLASGNYMSIINCLMQLRKVCNHPDLFVDRPIMTSFRQHKSVVADYAHIDQTIHRRLLAEDPMSKVSLNFLNLIPAHHEHLSTTKAESVAKLSSNRTLLELREAQKLRAHDAYTNLDPSTVGSNIGYLESAARWGRFEELQHCVYLNALRRQQKPIYGENLVALLKVGIDERPSKPRPKVPSKILAWFEEDSSIIRTFSPSVDQRADSLKTIIEKFSCVTPAVVTRDLDQLVLGRAGVNAFTEKDLALSAPVRWTPWMPAEPPLDPWHEARMRSSIQFPDKRLLQYDCGKLQVLDRLLRKLHDGGHRALIFTQMTKVLDILEQFLNIHGHKYLRLDGATKVEQRQIMTDRFNNDPRITCFILSTRSGGLGINLTGADTVIFYDQDWNPAMDKQCQDRCHRIGQTRDVHIYRLVSEHTIEANILRKASQKQMLDDVVIQEGDFTTDYFNKLSVRDVLDENVDDTSEGVTAADAALDRVLGGPDSSRNEKSVGRALEQAEDREDVTAARAAEKEIQVDEEDFTEKSSNQASGVSTARQGSPILATADDPVQAEPEIGVEYNAWGDKMRTIDDYMLGLITEQLQHTKLEIPRDKKKSKKKKGKDMRKR